MVGQIVRHYRAQRESLPLWFWRTAQGEEVDLLVERGGRFVAVECRLSEQPGTEALRGFQSLARFYGDAALEAGFIASRVKHLYLLKEAPPVRAVAITALIDSLP